jgi:hypothetical protein
MNEDKNKVTDIEDHRPKGPEEIELNNFQLNLVRMSKATNDLMAAADIPKTAKLKIYTFFMGIMDRPEVKALFKTIDETAAEHLKENPTAELMIADPLFKEIYEQESGVKVKKLQLTGEDIPDTFSSADMIGLSWLIDFPKE